MSSSKPTVVLAHGSWHSPEHFAPLEANLQAHGHRTNSVWLPTMHYSRVDPPLSPAEVTLLDDIRAVRSAILDELSKNPTVDVLVLGHSSGAIVAAGAVEKLDKSARTLAGYTNGVTGLLIISGLLVPAGTTVLQWAGGQTPPIVSRATIPDPSDVAKEIEVSTVKPNPGPAAVFYHDLSDEDAKTYADLCTHQLWKVNETVIPFAGWTIPDLKVFYLVCEEDRALPPAFQIVMIDNAGRDIEALESGKDVEGADPGGKTLEKLQIDSLAAIEASRAILEDVKAGGQGTADKGVASGQDGPANKIQVTSIQSSHSPFLSRVEETAQWIRGCSGEQI